MNDNINNVFNETGSPNSFSRVDDSHILDLYLGKDQMFRNTLLLITNEEPAQIYSSQIISIQGGLRNDDKWALSFSLVNDKYEELFCNYCSDMIESSRLLKDRSQGTSFICNRYMLWQEMLRKNALGLLPLIEIKGLLGELFFLLHYLLPTYGAGIALQSWIGPEKSDQDFVCPDKWFEVKATSSGSASVRISSVEQLDAHREGELVLIYLDKTSSADPNKITLNAMVKDVEIALSSDDLKEKLYDILIKQGYFFRPEYDEHKFRFERMDCYCVNGDFPAIRRKGLPNAVELVNYSISITAIQDYKVEK